MITDTTVFKKTVSTCLKETSPLLVAQMLKQCCSHMRESACSWHVYPCISMHCHLKTAYVTSQNHTLQFTTPHPTEVTD